MTAEASSYAIIFPVAAILLTVVLIPLVRRLAIYAGYVDEPGGRKTHAEPIPPIGGIVVFSVFMALSAFLPSELGDIRAFYAALVLVLVTGIIDDAKPVNAKLKFLIHFMSAGLVVIFGGAQIETLGNLLGFGDMQLGTIAATLFSIACVVYIINAINMMDGLDGLAGGKCLIILLWLMGACAVDGWWQAFAGLATLAGALVGFLIYNMRHPFRSRAAIFLGDAGSMALGLSIAWFAIGLSQGDHPVMAPVSVAWIIALPIIDAFALLVTRLKEGKHPFEPDRRHFHHHFVNAGFSVRHSTMLILLWGATLGAIGFFGLMAGIPEPVLGWCWVALWIGHTFMVTKSEKFVNWLTKLRANSGSSQIQP